MKDGLLHAYAIVVALSVLFVISTGAVVTNSLATPSPDAMAAATGLFSPKAHQHEAELVGVLTLLLLAWVFVSEKRPLTRRIAWFPLVIVFAEIGLGHAAGKASPTVSMVHAFLAPVLLASLAALGFAMSPIWRREPVMIEDRGWPPLRGLARTALVFVVLQVALGASFRHGEIGVLYHVVGALLLVLTLLAFVVCLTTLANHPLLGPASITLLVLTFVQVFLGLTVLVMSDRTLAKLAGLLVGAAHVALASLILSVTVIVAMETHRSVLRKA
jgi:heme A synthase